MAYSSRFPLALLRSVVGIAAVLVCSYAASAEERNVAAYGFAKPPLEIAGRIATLKAGGGTTLSVNETVALKSIWDRRQKDPQARIQEKALLEAMFFASGVDAKNHKKYIAQFSQITVKAKAALKDAKTPYRRGELLMAFLHKEVMSKGYQAEQSLLHTTLDTGVYNCVSATAMVYLVGTNLGLKFKPLSITGNAFQAGHATLDMFDGKTWIEVEATNPDGFDWKKKLSRPGVVSIGPRPDRSKAEATDGPGVAAMIYCNRGTTVSKAKQPAAAANLYLAALTLWPRDTTSTNNLEGLLVNWGGELAKDKKFEEAIRVTTFGLSVAPKVRGLRNNHHYAWENYVFHLLESSKDADAVRVLARAHKTNPDEARYKNPSDWFCRHGEEVRGKQGTKAALRVADRALKILPPEEAKKVVAWKSRLQERPSLNWAVAGDETIALVLDYPLIPWHARIQTAAIPFASFPPARTAPLP